MALCPLRFLGPTHKPVEPSHLLPNISLVCCCITACAPRPLEHFSSARAVCTALTSHSHRGQPPGPALFYYILVGRWLHMIAYMFGVVRECAFRVMCISL